MYIFNAPLVILTAYFNKNVHITWNVGNTYMFIVKYRFNPSSAEILVYKSRDHFFLNKCLLFVSYPFHLNTYVMGLRPL